MPLTIHKYIFKEIWPTLLVGLFVFVFIVLATRMLTITEWVISQGVPFSQILKLIFYLLPNIIIFALPASTLMAVLVAFLRLSGDNEIIALRSSGLSLYQLLPPVIVISGLCYILASFITFFAAPWGNRSFKDLVFQIAEARADISIKDRAFCEPFENVTFYINSLSKSDRSMKDVFVVDRRDDSVTNTIVAKEGRFILNPKARAITIHFGDGTILMVEKNRTSIRNIRFDTYELYLGLDDIMPAITSRKVAPKEMYPLELVEHINKMPRSETAYDEMATELLEKLSIPLAVFLMGMIGVPLGAQIRVGGRTVGILVSLIIFLVFYTCLAAVRNIAETGMISPYFGVWIPDVFLIACFVYLMHRGVKEYSIHFFEKIVHIGEVKRA